MMKTLFRTFFAAVLLFLGCAVAVSAQNAEPKDNDLTWGKDLLVKGTPAPDFTLNDIDGKPVSLSQFKGKKIVLVFWASWCPDCRAEVPELKAMMASPKTKNVVFVSVSFDRKEEAFKKYVRENEIGGYQLFDPAGKKDSAAGAAYNVNWIPSLYLIGQDGKVQLGTVVIGKISKALGL